MSITIKQFAKRVRKYNYDAKSCYIAIMRIRAPERGVFTNVPVGRCEPGGDADMYDGYDLEVETVPRAVIGGTWRAYTNDIKEARRMADQLEAALRELGFSIYKTRRAWESSVGDRGSMNDDNEKRAERAEAAIRAYIVARDGGVEQSGGVEAWSNLSDLLTDLRHFADAQGFDFAELNASASDQHREETAKKA